MDSDALPFVKLVLSLLRGVGAVGFPAATSYRIGALMLWDFLIEFYLFHDLV